MPIIKSKNFILRPFKKSDAKSLTENINNKKIYRNTARIPYPYTLKHANKWLEKTIKENRKKKPAKINFAIDINGEVIGSINFNKIEGHRAELNYWLAEKYWNRGIMTKAIKLMTVFGFNRKGLKRIYARVYSFNKASHRVLEKSGYKLEGILKKEGKKDNKFIDAYLFARVK